MQTLSLFGFGEKGWGLLLLLGALTAWAKVSQSWLARFVGKTYTTVFRGVPELLIIMMATGAAASRSIGSASEPSVSISTSLTILTTIWPGVTDGCQARADRQIGLRRSPPHHARATRDDGRDRRTPSPRRTSFRCRVFSTVDDRCG